jgi:hypothetical protein
MREPVNERRTVPGPMIDVNFFGKWSNPNTRIRNPRSGKTGTRVIKRNIIIELRIKKNLLFA